jgi:DNA-directed RNA polymerase subunit beta
MQGRNEALNAIVKGKVIPKPGIPESFRVLIRELQSLALDIGIYKAVIKSDGNFEFNEVNLMTTSTLVADLPLPNYESLSQGLLLPKELDI